MSGACEDVLSPGNMPRGGLAYVLNHVTSPRRNSTLHHHYITPVLAEVIGKRKVGHKWEFYVHYLSCECEKF